MQSANLDLKDWDKIHALKRAFDEQYAVPITDLKAEEEGEPGEVVMSREAWLAARKASFSLLEEEGCLTKEFEDYRKKHTIDYTVTASECAAVLGKDPWTSKVERWHEKKNRMPMVPKEVNKDALLRGQLAEDYVLYVAKRILTEKYGKENVWIWSDKRIFVSKKYPWMFCNTDGHAVVMKDGKAHFILIEAKTVSVRAEKVQECYKSGIFPENYILQCRHEMATFGAEAVMLICVWSLEVDGYAYTMIGRDPQEEMRLICAEKEFVHSLREDTEPVDLASPLLASSFYGRLYAEETKEEVLLTDDCKDALVAIMDIDQKIADLKASMDELSKERAVHTNRLAGIVKDASRARLPVEGGVYLVKEKRNRGHKTYDFARLKQDHPEVYQKAVKMVEKLDTSKAKDFADLGKYTIPGAYTSSTWTVEFKKDDGK
uniref:YqaJ viral recombinase family protein n=1 Tax=Eubacterium cellulosolvens TaxID=29322 RepID=UPI00047FC81A|nr:YqaJ viral recombinase family protein [[Eubacterium] cellulosolvens]